MSDPANISEAAEPPVVWHWYYICDKCGSIVTITDAAIPEGEEWQCADCGSAAIWEFQSKAQAIQHSRHIQDLVRSGLFRGAR